VLPSIPPPTHRRHPHRGPPRTTKTARIWMQTPARSSHAFRHRDSVDSAAYSPDGTRLVTARTTRPRDLGCAHGHAAARASGHGDAVGSAAYSPDGARIVTASFDKTARIWDARVPASIDAQIIWATSAETDPVVRCRSKGTGTAALFACQNLADQGIGLDQATAAFYDPERLALAHHKPHQCGYCHLVLLRGDCQVRATARLDYQMGRALLAKGT